MPKGQRVEEILGMLWAYQNDNRDKSDESLFTVAFGT